MVDAFDAEPTLRVDAPDWFRRALEVPFEQRSVEVDGCDINFLQWGAPSDEGLVFVHGGGAHAHWWTHIAGAFSAHARCVALDLSGHGDSGRRNDYSLDHWTDEVAAVANAAGITRPVIVGHSMGGFVTIATAARHPEVPSAIVIVDSPVFDTEPEVTEARKRAQAPAGPAPIHPDLDAVVGRYRTIPPQARYLDFVIDHVARRSLRQVETPDGGIGWQWKFDPAFWTAMGGSPRTFALPYLDQIGCRVALLRCEEGLVDAEIGRFMYERMGRRTPVVELPTAGHHPMLDSPLVLITALRTLFADWRHSDPRPPVA
ncbi:MAG: alpha/beta fold hydrolase [Acidimicrobiales bacterium]